MAKVLAKLGREADGEENTVHRIIMNPKAMTINQMYGFFDELNEWNDGILATTYRFRILCQDPAKAAIVASPQDSAPPSASAVLQCECPCA